MNAITPNAIEEISILSEIRLINQKDLNHTNSTENIKVSFELSGQVKGRITCYLVLDFLEMSESDKQLIYPVFVEAMNILVGQQISSDPLLKKLNISLSAPKPSLISENIYTKLKNQTQKYELQMEHYDLDVLINYSLEVIN